jgi:hypothetical protein
MRQTATLLLSIAAQAACAQDVGEWNFTATLDGQPIGTHRFTVRGAGAGAERSVFSSAQFVVKWLGIPVYRYRHEARESWQDDCLRELRSDTDDDGKREQVDRRFDGECQMGFAYWNPRLVQQHRLVDPRTGRSSAVRFEALPDAQIDVRGRSVAAQGWRLVADKQRITVWYAAETGRWIALDAEAKGGRRLGYRLTADERPPP